jgi:hypothetical protein
MKREKIWFDAEGGDGTIGFVLYRRKEGFEVHVQEVYDQKEEGQKRFMKEKEKLIMDHTHMEFLDKGDDERHLSMVYKISFDEVNAEKAFADSREAFRNLTERARVRSGELA